MSQIEPQNPVVLVHGLNDTARIFQPMTTTLQQLGWSVHSLDLLPANGDRELNELAQQLADFIQATLPPHQPFDLVGFSMGGMVSRYYLQRLGGIQRVQRCITIASPHNGTLTAFATQRPGCVQMRPNSPFLNDLNRDLPVLERINFTSIWTPLDLMIIPAQSSQMWVGKDIQVLVPLHPWMVTTPQGIAAVVEELRAPLRRPVSC
jgi:triacylglycerol lipase